MVRRVRCYSVRRLLVGFGFDPAYLGFGFVQGRHHLGFGFVLVSASSVQFGFDLSSGSTLFGLLLCSVLRRCLSFGFDLVRVIRYWSRPVALPITGRGSKLTSLLVGYCHYCVAYSLASHCCRVCAQSGLSVICTGPVGTGSVLPLSGLCCRPFAALRKSASVCVGLLAHRC